MVAKAIANSLSQEIRRRLALNAEALELFLECRSPADSVVGYSQWRGKLHAADQADLPGEPNLTWPACREAIEKYLGAQHVQTAMPDPELERLRTAAAEEGRGYFLTISGPELLNKFVGETEYSIRRIFMLAQEGDAGYPGGDLLRRVGEHVQPPRLAHLVGH